MSDWKLRAACRNHPTPEWWFPHEVSDQATDAKKVCVTCPVRRECGDHAIDTDEKHAVMGGYRCSNDFERTALRKWLGRSALRTRTCRGCGTEFETAQPRHNCLDCRGLVPVEPVQAHILALRAAGVTNVAISEISGVAAGTIAKLATGHPQYEWRHCSKAIADKIRAVPVPTPGPT